MALLDNINSPRDVQKLSTEELVLLSGEIRSLILDVVRQNGGHLASNLGTVELITAMYHVFDLPRDRIVWDVGHQCYAHKILSGRRRFFTTLRKTGGCSGFPSPPESPEYDVSVGGHAGVAISTALGFAAADAAAGEDRKTIAFLGDGALNCGISLEGLNNVRSDDGRLIVILNDNKMSIDKNVGGFSSYLNRILVNRRYSILKSRIRNFLARTPGGDGIIRFISRAEAFAKGLILPGAVFEELGMRYLGPINGHNMNELVKTLSSARNSDRPVLVHVVTQKGHGYDPAVFEPEKFHGVTPDSFAPMPPEHAGTTRRKNSFSDVFGKVMLELAARHPDLDAVVAAMTGGVGLHDFAREHRDRLHDCGIAEAHAVVFAAGLVNGGRRVVTAIYDSFMQRALDNIYHDVCLAAVPLVMALDRAGVVEDGPTHHGIYSLGFLRAMPHLVIMEPADGDMLRDMLRSALHYRLPAVIRYPKGDAGTFAPAGEGRILPFGKGRVLAPGKDAVLWASGAECRTALRVRELLAEKYRFDLEVVDPVFLKPLDVALAAEGDGRKRFTLEDHVVDGGLASALADAGFPVDFRFGWPCDREIPHGKVADLRAQYHLRAEDIAEKIGEILSQCV